MLNPQERHEKAIYMLKHLRPMAIDPNDPSIKFWERENDAAIAAYYGYKTVAELELAGKACWR